MKYKLVLLSDWFVLASQYLLETLGDGGDGGHPAGDGRQHVPVGSHRAVEVPLLRSDTPVYHSRSRLAHQPTPHPPTLTTASRTITLATWSGWQTPEVSEINLVSRG